MKRDVFFDLRSYEFSNFVAFQCCLVPHYGRPAFVPLSVFLLSASLLVRAHATNEANLFPTCLVVVKGFCMRIDNMLTCVAKRVLDQDARFL